MRAARIGLAAAAAAATLVSAPAASAELKTVTVRQGPIKVAPYAVKYTTRRTRFVRSPGIDGFLVGMHARVVDRRGRPLPVQRLMLHHIVYKNHGRRPGERPDPVCGGPSESFYGTGEENHTLRFPPGYGYRVRAGERWQVGWMLMNHRRRTDSAYIEYRATVDTSPGLKALTPYWLRVTGCRSARDPIFTVPGGGRRGSNDRRSSGFTVPRAGRLVAAGGHAHGGARALSISQPACGGRSLLSSTPTFGRPDHPYYRVLPVLHEPGPMNMSWQQTATGIPVGARERLRVSSLYDAELPHVRAMGIMHAYVDHTDAAGPRCAPLPGDIETNATTIPGRREPPRVRVPLTGLDRRGRARRISRPPGRVRRARGSVTVVVGETSFRPRNLSVPSGARVRWRFRTRRSHNVSLASGPVGFASPNLRRGRTWSRRFTKPGLYRNLCTLHPVQMTQTIRVRKRRRR